MHSFLLRVSNNDFIGNWPETPFSDSKPRYERVAIVINLRSGKSKEESSRLEVLRLSSLGLEARHQTNVQTNC